MGAKQHSTDRAKVKWGWVGTILGGKGHANLSELRLGTLLALAQTMPTIVHVHSGYS